jgi:hypothetical protein
VKQLQAREIWITSIERRAVMIMEVILVVMFKVFVERGKESVVYCSSIVKLS